MAILERDALLSSDGKYRYWLTRRWDETRQLDTVTWVMLNPSTADGVEDDQTMRRVTALSASWGYGACVVVNLFGLVSTDPKLLASHPDPIGPANAHWVRHFIGTSGATVAAWGASHPRALAHHVDSMSLDLRLSGAPVIGLTAKGDPRHPSRVRRDARLQEWAMST